MSNDDDVLRQQGPASGLSRRDALRKLGLFGAAAVVAPAVLAACGGDDDDDAGGGGGATTTAAGGGGTGARRRHPAGDAARHRPGGKNGKGVAFDARRRAGPHRQRLVLRQDDDAAALDLAVKHIEAAGGPNDHRTSTSTTSRATPRPAMQAITELGAQEACRPSSPPTSTTSARCSPGTDAVQDLHARRRRRHQHLRPGPALLLGHPGDHAERPAAGPVQVPQGDAPRRQDRRPDRLGHRRAEQQRSSRRTSSRRSPTPGYEFNGLYELVPVGSQDFSPGAPEDQGQRARHPARRHLRPGPGFVRRPGADGRPEGDAVSASSSRPTASTRRRAPTTATAARSPTTTSTPSNPISPLAKLFVRGVPARSTARTPTSTPPTSTRTRS